MMDRRAFLALGGVSFLAACVGTTPLLEEGVSRSIVVQQVAVDGSKVGKVSGRSLDVSGSQIESDIRRSLERRMLGRGSKTGTPVRVDVRLTSVLLVSPGMSLLVGGSSSISAEVSVVDLNTGKLLLEPTKVSATGDGYAPGGIIGAASRGTPAEDYSNTVGSFADSVSKRLLGTSGSAPAAAPGVTGSPDMPAGGFNADRPAVWRL